MKTCNKCHSKKIEKEFTHGKAVCKPCRASIIKNEREQEKVSKLQKENDDLLRQEFYKEAENENSSLTTPKQLEEMYHDPKHLNLISS